MRHIQFIRWFREFSFTTNLQIFPENEFFKFFLNKYLLIFLGKIRRFVVTEFVKLSDEFDVEVNRRKLFRCLLGFVS